jgi:hypothetical protein
MNRRGFLTGLVSALAAPLVVRAENLMPLRGIKVPLDYEVPEWCPPGWIPASGQTLHRLQFPELHAIYKKQRLYGAHLSDNFSLPAAPFRDSMGLRPHGVTLVNFAPMARPNGRVCQPGMMDTFAASMPEVSPSPLQPHTLDEFVGFGWNSQVEYNP